MNIRPFLIEKARSPWVLLLVAIAVAAGISLLAFNYLDSRERHIKEEAAAQAARVAAGKRVPEVRVVVPVADAGIGTVISSQAFAARSIAQDLLYSDTIKASDFEFFSGQKLAKPLQKGRPLRISDLIAPEVRDVAAVVPAGKRAVTISIDNLNSIAQTVRPGNLLDIFLVSRAPQLDEKVPAETLDQTMLFMQNMEVLAVGRDFNDPRLHPDLKQNMVRPGEVAGSNSRGYDTVTLLVTPAQAEKLIIGQKMGAYRVALRGRGDDSPLDLAVLKASDFMPSLPKRDQGIEFIVGGTSRGAGLVSTLRPTAAGAPPAPPAAAINPLSAEALEAALMNMATAADASERANRRGQAASDFVDTP